MAQGYQNFPGSQTVAVSRPLIEERFETLRSQFSGTAFPVADADTPAPIVGQTCYRTDLGALYICTDATTPVWELVNLDFFLALTGGTLTGVLNLAYGADIASASTINLTTATGNYLNVTGAVQINTITLGQGMWRLCYFASALTIAHNASNVVCPQGINLKVRAGDRILFVGDASGVVRPALLMRADGTAWYTGSKGSNVASAATVDLTATEDLIHLTGSTTVTAITLPSGQERTLVLDGTIPFTNSANLICPGGRDLSLDANSVVVVRGDGSGITRIILARPANGLKHVGKEVLPFKAPSFSPAQTSGCAEVARSYTTTNKVAYYACAFDGSANEYAWIDVGTVPSWNGGAIEVRFRWRCGTTGNVVLGAAACAFGNGQSSDAALGTAAETTDTNTGANNENVSDWITVTPAGTSIDGGHSLAVRFYRKAADALDTINGVDIQITQVEVRMVMNKPSDA